LRVHVVAGCNPISTETVRAALESINAGEAVAVHGRRKMEHRPCRSICAEKMTSRKGTEMQRNVFAIVQDPTEYDVWREGLAPSGLFTSYFHDIDLFNWITRASMSPFQYEPFSAVEPVKRHCRIGCEEIYRADLDKSVGGRTVRMLCRNLNPEEMYNFFRKHEQDVRELGIAKKLCELGGLEPEAEVLLTIVRTRALQWKRYRRGVVSRSSKVVRAQFGTKLTAEEENFLLEWNMYHEKHPAAMSGRLGRIHARRGRWAQIQAKTLATRRISGADQPAMPDAGRDNHIFPQPALNEGKR
jgi:hypothetical protein